MERMTGINGNTLDQVKSMVLEKVKCRRLLLTPDALKDTKRTGNKED